MSEEYKLIPLQKTQSFPVAWKFSQDDYQKLAKGYRSNWCVFLRDDFVHFCRVGGEEFYRFRMNEIENYTYEVKSIETYIRSTQMTHGLSEAQIRDSDNAFLSLAQDEIEGLLMSYFDIDINQT